MDSINNAIKAASKEDPNSFRDYIHAALTTKVNDALELRKIDVASSFFNDKSGSGSVQEIESNEDV